MTPSELFALGCLVAAALVVLHAVARAVGRPPERTHALTLLVGGQALYLLAEVGAEGAFGLAVEPAPSPRVTLTLLVVAVGCQLAGGGLFLRWWLGRIDEGDETVPPGERSPQQ